MAILNTRRFYKCDVCGHVSVWGPTWSQYGSILHEEVCPDALPHTCSSACKDKAQAHFDSGEWRLPMLYGGPNPRITQPKKGY